MLFPVTLAGETGRFSGSGHIVGTKCVLLPFSGQGAVEQFKGLLRNDS